MQLVTPEIVVEPYSEIMSCWYTTVDTERGVWVESIQSWQGEYGHHVIGFLTDESTDEVPDGTVVDCIEPEAMARYIPVLTPTLTPDDNDRVDMPDGVAMRLRVGTRLAIQSHYVNTSAEQIRRSDVVNITYADAGATPTPAAPWMVTTFDAAIPPGGMHSESYECAVPSDINIYSLVGHMHEAGAQITIEGGPRDDLEMLYRVDEWEDEFRDNPPMRELALADSIALAKGDTLRVSCTWDARNEQRTMTFPTEMCASVMWFYPAIKPLFCAASLLSQ